MKKLIALCAVLVACAFSFSAGALSRDFAAVRINELMASNGDTIRDGQGESSDWIELRNISEEDIDLSGLCLSDGKKNLEKYVFPEGIVLPAGGYLLVFCSDSERILTLDDGSKEIHVAFKLAAEGEKVVLSYQNTILDIVRFDQQTRDVSWALREDGSWAFSHTPTPGYENAF